MTATERARALWENECLGGLSSAADPYFKAAGLVPDLIAENEELRAKLAVAVEALNEACVSVKAIAACQYKLPDKIRDIAMVAEIELFAALAQIKGDSE